MKRFERFPSNKAYERSFGSEDFDTVFSLEN